MIINRDGKLLRPKRLPSNLFQFRAGTGEDRCVLDCITSLQNGADLLWIETEKPHIEQIAGMMDRIREVVPNAKLAYNNSPSFNWTLNFRQQVYDAWKAAGKDVSRLRPRQADERRITTTPTLATEADERIRTFQADAAKRAGIFHHLITLPTYHTAALSTDNLAKEYFGEQGMLGYVQERAAPGNPPGHRLREAPEHVGLRHRRRPQGIFRRRSRPEGRRRPQHDEPVRLNERRLTMTAGSNFWVIGGEFGSMNFHKLVEGSAQVQGPFKTRREAEDAWRTVSEENRHKAGVRFSIVEEPARVPA